MARKAMSLHMALEQREQLEELKAYHQGAGRSHMSMTHILEVLVAREHRRLKLHERNQRSATG